MTRLIALLAFALTLSACSTTDELNQIPEPMGRFLLGHNVVVVDNPEVGPLSREASDEEWKAAMEAAIDERFGRYDGDKYFHIAVKVDAYVLALPGIPVVASPKSILIVSVTIWDDEKGIKLNDEPERFTVFEKLSGETAISSGLTQSKEQQMQNLTRNAAKKIHEWMLENIEWFGDASLMDPATTSPGFPANAARIDDAVTPTEPES
ncbi:MAG TPA: hypothetical protein ENK28_08885 [Aliiroseovarius sp.]|nr:hypothetical protein [Aliiroseovarius sp.]